MIGYKYNTPKTDVLSVKVMQTVVLATVPEDVTCAMCIGPLVTYTHEGVGNVTDQQILFVVAEVELKCR